MYASHKLHEVLDSVKILIVNKKEMVLKKIALLSYHLQKQIFIKLKTDVKYTTCKFKINNKFNLFIIKNLFSKDF